MISKFNAFLLVAAALLLSTAVFAQQDEIPQAHKLYKFTPVIDLKATSPKNQDETIFYKVKDSFNQETNPVTNGYVYMSRSYIMMRTITILVHKDAIPTNIRKAIGII